MCAVVTNLLISVIRGSSLEASDLNIMNREEVVEGLNRSTCISSVSFFVYDQCQVLSSFKGYPRYPLLCQFVMLLKVIHLLLHLVSCLTFTALTSVSFNSQILMAPLLASSFFIRFCLWSWRRDQVLAKLCAVHSIQAIE